MAGIGHLCLQWARLELAVIGVLITIEDMTVEKGEIIFGGLDIIPRINMALGLGLHNKIPLRFTKRLTAVRKALRDGLAADRNTLVHGAHRPMENGATTLRMSRLKGEKKEQSFTPLQIGKIGAEIHALANECWSIRDDIGVWKFGPDSKEDGANDLASGTPVVGLELAKRIHASVQRLWRKFKR